jgi:hypothetical protein
MATIEVPATAVQDACQQAIKVANEDLPPGTYTNRHLANFEAAKAHAKNELVRFAAFEGIASIALKFDPDAFVRLDLEEALLLAPFLSILPDKQPQVIASGV